MSQLQPKTDAWARWPVTRSFEFLCGLMPRDVADIVEAYRRPESMLAEDVARGDYHELWPTSGDARLHVFRYACFVGNVDCAKAMVKAGVKAYDLGLSEACEGNQPRTAGLMVAYGATRCRHCRQRHVLQ